jgi:hypothetical protein
VLLAAATKMDTYYHSHDPSTPLLGLFAALPPLFFAKFAKKSFNLWFSISTFSPPPAAFPFGVLGLLLPRVVEDSSVERVASRSYNIGVSTYTLHPARGKRREGKGTRTDLDLPNHLLGIDLNASHVKLHRPNVLLHMPSII